MSIIIEALQWVFTVVILKIIFAHWLANQIMQRSDFFKDIVERYKSLYEEEYRKLT